MELFGLLLAVPATMVLSTIYTAIALWSFGRWPLAKKVALPFSYGIVALVGVEFLLLAVFGAKSAFVHLHHAYTALHFVVFLLAPPAIANLVLHLTAKKNMKRWHQFTSGVACCWLACMTALLGNIVIDEAIVGVDAPKPFYMSLKADPGDADNSSTSHLRVRL
jgi:hypothetical protein